MNKELSKSQYNRIVHSVRESVLDTNMKEHLIKWMEYGDPVKIVERNSPSSRVVNAFKISQFISDISLFIKKLEDLTWKNYCEVQHHITSNIGRTFKNRYREMLQSFYFFVYRKTSNVAFKIYFEKYINLFISNEFRSLKTTFIIDEYTRRNIQTNFPLDSNPDQIVHAKYILPKNNKTETGNFFIDTNNPFLFSLIESYIHYLSENEKSRFNYLNRRILFTHLGFSLRDLKITNLKDFNEETFKTQVKYFKELLKQFQWNDETSDIRVNQLLLRFYIYVDDIHYRENGCRLFTSLSFNRDIWSKPNYIDLLENGYIFLSRTSQDHIPSMDKWIFVPHENDKIRSLSLRRNLTLDFTKVVNIEFRNDLKKYIWINKKSTDLTHKFLAVVDLLNDADLFYTSEMKVSYIHSQGIIKKFPTAFLILYYSKIVSDSTISPSYKNNKITRIRSFLEVIRFKYEIPVLVIKQLSFLAIDGDGGNAIEPDDFDKINNLFKDEDKLLYIIFQLSVSTKLRIGGVISLERNCILSVNEELGYGEVQFYTKTSNQELVKEIFMLKHIRLIQQAIELSQSAFEKASGGLKNYIFIGFSQKKKGKVIDLYSRYANTFSKIIDALYSSGKIQKQYTPYNARDTFIETAWQGVENGAISTLEVSYITGNTKEVALKHYRNRDIQRLMEATSGVLVDDVEVDGQITNNDSTIKSLLPVQQDAGACSSEDCIKKHRVEIEDSERICLTCTNFITTTERIPLFEHRVENYIKKREASNSITEKNYYNGLIKLYSTYLVDMYSLLEEKNE